ncbi:hypothetical protein ACFLWK_00790 [Chloroflexota bacterium]
MRKVKRLVLAFALIPLMAFAGCDAISEISNIGPSYGEATVTNIHFSADPRATHVVFDIEVKPNGALPDTRYFAFLLSRDGYYFGSRENVGWTQEELQGPDESERDYYKIQEAEERMIKRFKLGAPLTDKDVVALQEDCKIEAEKLAEEYARELWDNLLEGDLVELFKSAGKDPNLTKSEINKIFNRHLKIVVTDTEGFLKIEYPDGVIVKLGEFSGQGSFKTPIFSPKYEWLRITILSPTGCQGEGGLYYSDGKGSHYGTFHVWPDIDGKLFSMRLSVRPGEEYYYGFNIQDDMIWQLTIEESNMGWWIEELE